MTIILSDHFKEHELVFSETAMRNKIDNTPKDPVVITAAQQLALNVLEPIRKQFGGFSPTSWYRSEALEKIICANDFKVWCNARKLPINSESWAKYFALKSHPKGEAADVKIPGVSNEVLFDWIVKNLKFDQVIREYATAGQPFSGWVHVSYRGSQNRQQVLHIG
jgi:zinc D-Ala-D-Ala carboxypeptidase